MNEFPHDGTSILVENMKAEVETMDTFPVLFGDEIAWFHSVSGGYDRDRGYDVVNLHHEVQGVGSPTNLNFDRNTIEAHLRENYYNLEVTTIRKSGDYPDEDRVLSLRVTDYMAGPRSFSEAMSVDVDRRHERFNPNE